MTTVSVKVLRMVALGAAAVGVPQPELLAAAGLLPEQLADPDGRLPRRCELLLWQAAARLSRDEHFGLHLSERAQAGDFGGLGFAVRSSATVGEAYQRIVRYLRVLVQDARLELVVDRAAEGGAARLRSQRPPDGEPLSRHQIEFLLGMLLAAGRMGSGVDFMPREVRFAHPAPPRLAELVRIFGPALRFEQPVDELVFDSSLLRLPQHEAEPALAAVLDRHLQDLVARLPQSESFLDRVRGCLAGELARGEPSLSRVAQRLHMSPRSLQRRLHQEGQSLQSLLVELRVELARRYLAEPGESVSEVAFLLGFSEVSTFHRAFKRWTGQTPGEYRKSRLGDRE